MVMIFCFFAGVSFWGAGAVRGTGAAGVGDASLRDVCRRFVRTQFLRLVVLGVVKLIDLQNIAPTDNDERLIHVQPQDFIHCEKSPSADAARFAVFRGVVGNAPCTKLLGLTGHGDACFAGA